MCAKTVEANRPEVKLTPIVFRIDMMENESITLEQDVMPMSGYTSNGKKMQKA